MTADLQSAVQRALSAWDTTTLKTNGDGMLAEAMEALRTEFDSAVMLNGLTEAETNETASVKGLTASPAEGDATLTEEQIDRFIPERIGVRNWGKPEQADLFNRGQVRDAIRTAIASQPNVQPKAAEVDAAPWSKTVESAALLLQRCTGLELQDCENLAGTILGMAANVQPKGTATVKESLPVGKLTRKQIDDIMTEHYPLESLLRENVDAFEACVRDIEKALATQSPAPAPDADGGDLPCPRCSGSGFELQWSDASPDAHQVEVNCDHCDGAGSLGAAYTHLSQMLKSERERSKKHTDELHWLKSGPFFGLRADKSIQTVADRLDELADACGKYDPRSERASDIRAAATIWRKHLAGPAPCAAVGAELPPLPKVGPIGFASVVDIDAYAPWLKIGPHLPGVRDVALWTTDQMRAYARAALPAVQPKAAEAPEIGEVTWQQAADAIENLDDYARMMVGVDPSGPRETLYRFLEQAKAALANVQPKGTELTPDEIQALWSPYAGAAPFAFARKIEAAIAAKGSPTQAPAPAHETTVSEFTNELGNAIRITIEGPTSTSENVLTPMEAAKLRGALNEHAVQAPAPAHDDKVLTQALEERDAASDYIDALLNEVLGEDRNEWTSNYGHADAMDEVRERMASLQSSLDFYKSRCDALQACQSTMRDPERTMVCDILANGSLLFNGLGKLAAERYALQAPAVGADDEQDAARYRHWRDHAEVLCPVLRYESPAWIDAYLAEALAERDASQPPKAVFVVPVQGSQS